jgi:acyl-CoA thioesterase-1
MTGDDMREKTFLGAVAKGYGVAGPASNRAAAALFAATLAVAAVAPAASPAMAEPRIAALGDSLTQGYGLPEEEGFAPQLQAWLRDNGLPDAIVINAGVSGDTTAGGLARVDWVLGDDPDAVIVALGGNDLLRGIDPASSRANLDGILAAIAGRDLPVLLAGLPGAGNFGPEWRADFEAIFPDLAEQYGALYYPSFLAGLGQDPGAARALLQEDGLHPNAAGVRAMVEDIGPLVLELVAAGD